MSTQIQEEIKKLIKIQFKEQDCIGKGSFATVYRYQINNIPLAVKCFQDSKKAMQENDLLSKLQGLVPNCPGFIKYYGMQKLKIENLGDFSGSYEGYALFLQACQIDFQKMLRIGTKLTTKEVFNFLSQMSTSLLCLHLNNCFHGDIKPANILVSKDNSQKHFYYLTDYGEGKIVQELMQTDHKTISLRGTPFYFAPEL